MKIKLSSNCSAEGYSDWELNNVYLVRSILRSMVLCVIQLLWQAQSVLRFCLATTWMLYLRCIYAPPQHRRATPARRCRAS